MSAPLVMVAVMLIPIWIPVIGLTFGFFSDLLKKRAS